MSSRNNLRNVFLIILMLAMVLTFSYSASAQNSGGIQTFHAPVIKDVNPAHQSNSQILSILSKDKIPLKYAYLPSAEPRVIQKKGMVEPLYSVAPAPMGLSDLGLMNVSGQMVPYVLNTSSFEGTVNVNGLSPFYLDNDGPYSVSFQLNTVLTGVTLFGVTNYTFWNQNVVFYSARTHQLTFIDNIWNFSAPSAPLTQNSLLSYNGTPVVPEYYYAVGPTVTVTYPFTMHLFLNSTVINNNDAVFFNYSLVMSNGTVMSGSFDRVLFNSSYGMPSSYVTPTPYYQVNGFSVNPTGYLLNDAEIMIGGPGGGSTTSIFGINATMNLMYLNKGSYQNIPSAFGFGTDTGETSNGIAEWYSGETAHLGPGPSVLIPMWNVSSSPGYIRVSGKVSPSNAFLFMNTGPFNASLAQWAPVPVTGDFTYNLYPGTYSGEAMLSEYNIQNFEVKGNSYLNVQLMRNNMTGVYTPLWAMSNSQLKYISSHGDGSMSNPYVIENNQYTPINPLFSQFNDFLFPVFPGLMIVNTTSYTTATPPSFFFSYPNQDAPVMNFYGFPMFNFLQSELYNTSHVSIYKADFTGWFPYYANGFPEANLIVWNSTSDLIAGNTFSSMGSSMLIYGGSGNLIWNNEFAQSMQIANPQVLMYGSTPIGLSVYSSGNTIFNNFFNVEIAAYSPNYNIYNGYPGIWNDTWNISIEPSSYSFTFNGFTITGSIINQPTVSGNYWWDFNGTAPFDNYGLIYSGGDYNPIVPSYYYVNVTINGLPSGSLSYLFLTNTMNNHIFQFVAVGNSTVSALVFNGTYSVSIFYNGGYYSSYSRTVKVNGASVNIEISL